MMIYLCSSYFVIVYFTLCSICCSVCGVFLYLLFNTAVYLTCSCLACLSACELSFKSLCCICLIFMPACINSVLVWRLRLLHVNMTFTIYLLHGTTYLLLSYMCHYSVYTLWCLLLYFVVYLYLFFNTVVYLTYCCCSACLRACELSFKSRCCICLNIMLACIIRLSRFGDARLLRVNMTFTIYLLHGITCLLLCYLVFFL